MLHQPVDQFQPSQTRANECVVADMGRRFERAFRQFNFLDGSQSIDPYDRTAARNTASALMEVTRSAGALTQAISPEGALFQIISAYGDFNAIYDCLDEDSENYSFSIECATRLDAALKSVRRFLEAQFSVDGRVLGGDYWMSMQYGFIEKLEKLAPTGEQPFAPLSERPPVLQAAE